MNNKNDDVYKVKLDEILSLINDLQKFDNILNQVGMEYIKNIDFVINYTTEIIKDIKNANSYTNLGNIKDKLINDLQGIDNALRDIKYYYINIFKNNNFEVYHNNKDIVKNKIKEIKYYSHNIIENIEKDNVSYIDKNNITKYIQELDEKINKFFNIY